MSWCLPDNSRNLANWALVLQIIAKMHNFEWKQVKHDQVFHFHRRCCRWRTAPTAPRGPSRTRSTSDNELSDVRWDERESEWEEWMSVARDTAVEKWEVIRSPPQIRRTKSLKKQENGWSQSGREERQNLKLFLLLCMQGSAVEGYRDALKGGSQVVWKWGE